MSLLRILLFLLGLRLRRQVAHLNPRVRIILPAPSSWRSHHYMDNVNRVQAVAGATVATINLSPTHADGSSGHVDGSPTYTTSGLCTLQPSADGLSASVVSTGEIGTADVTISADGDLGSGVVTISDVVHFSFEAPPEPLTEHLNPSVAILLPVVADQAPVANLSALADGAA